MNQNGKRCTTCRKYGRPAMCILYDKRQEASDFRIIAEIEKRAKGYCEEWEAKQTKRLHK